MPKKKELTRNAGTMSEAEFWGRIRSLLRGFSMYWKPIVHAKLAARRKSQRKDNKRLKYEYQCAICKEWFKGDEVHVDHIIPAGSLKNGDDLKGFVERLYCEDGFRVLCIECHKKVTKDAKRTIQE